MKKMDERIEKKLISTIKKLDTDKVAELMSDVKNRKEKAEWDNKFKAFLSQVEEDAPNMLDEETKNKILAVRKAHKKS